MPWRMSGQMLESCSCQMLCPCILGPAHPDAGWCGGAVVFDIQQGNADAVSLAGRKAVFAVDMPGDFMNGHITARLYVDDGASADQRRELEGIFTGKKGGSFAGMSGLITKWLPTQAVRIAVQAGDNATVTIGSVGQLKLAKVKNEAGQQTKVEGAALLRGFGVQTLELARGDGGYFTDPDMRRWVSGGSGSASAFSLNS